ncbi:MAG: nucleic acid-binding protein [Acidimicrobiia bacterium]|nr:nucleic acid-binding protein [Acidimicrobiia bacterium]
MTIRPPVFDFDDAFFWEGAAQRRLLIQHCAACDTVRHPPTPVCPECGSLEQGAIESQGRGTILTWIVSRHPTEPDAEPRIVILVQLDEGTRLVSNLVDAEPAPTLNDARVEVCFVDHDGTVLPLFRLAGSGR